MNKMRTLTEQLQVLSDYQKQQNKLPSSISSLLPCPQKFRWFKLEQQALAFDALLSQAYINASFKLHALIGADEWAEFLTNWVEVYESENGQSIELRLISAFPLVKLSKEKNHWLVTSLGDCKAANPTLHSHVVELLESNFGLCGLIDSYPEPIAEKNAKNAFYEFNVADFKRHTSTVLPCTESSLLAAIKCISDALPPLIRGINHYANTELQIQQGEILSLCYFFKLLEQSHCLPSNLHHLISEFNKAMKVGQVVNNKVCFGEIKETIPTFSLPVQERLAILVFNYEVLENLNIMYFGLHCAQSKQNKFDISQCADSDVIIKNHQCEFELLYKLDALVSCELSAESVS